MDQIQWIPRDKIIANPQVRTVMDQESLVGLAASMKEVGQLQPCRVRRVGEALVLIHGERRWRAAKIAGINALAVIVEDPEPDTGRDLQCQLIENIQREDLLPMEKARGIAELMRVTGWKIGETATRLGLSNASATRLIALLDLPAEIQERVASGTIPASAAYKLSLIKDPAQQSKLADDIAAGRLTRDGLVGVIKAESQPRTGGKKQAIGRATAKLEGRRSITVSGPDLDLEVFITALEELLTRARRARPQGVELGTFLAMLKDQQRAVPAS